MPNDHKKPAPSNQDKVEGAKETGSRLADKGAQEHSPQARKALEIGKQAEG